MKDAASNTALGAPENCGEDDGFSRLVEFFEILLEVDSKRKQDD